MIKNKENDTKCQKIRENERKKENVEKKGKMKKMKVPGEVETRVEFFMAPKNAAPERCKNHNVAGFSLELECLDDGQDTK